MAEFFELTVYCKNKFFKNCRVDLSEIVEISKAATFDIVDHGEYSAYTFNFESFIFTKENFENTLDMFSKITKHIFDKLDNVLFLSGIYELTGYYTIGINKIKELDDILIKFPLLFFRQGEEKGFDVYKSVNEISVIYNKKAQDLFVDLL